MEETLKIPTMRTVRETAKLTGVPEGRIREFVKKGLIVFVPCGNRALINLEKFIEFMNTSKGNIESKVISNKFGIEPIN